MTKCLHEPCQNEAEDLSAYCKDCVQLPTYDCNRCNSRSDRKPSKKSIDVHTKNIDETFRSIITKKEEEDEQLHKVMSGIIRLLIYIIGFVVMLKIIMVILK